MGYQIDGMIENAVQNIGDLSLIRKVFQNAIGGEDLCVAFIGGSITMGSLASNPNSCYAYLVYNWFKQQFPQNKVTYINGGIGATCSHFGVARVEIDVLYGKPDLVFVEYSVNDKANVYYAETYEGLIRKILKCSWEPAVVIINSVEYDTGNNAEDYHNKIGRYYNLPIISMKDSIYEEVKKGNIRREDITPDYLHPNDEGHKLMAQIINFYLNKILNNELSRDKDCKLSGNYTKDILARNSITNNGYEDAIRYQNNNILPKVQGFLVDKEEQENICDVFKNGWYSRKIGDKLIFNIVGGNVAIQYRKSVTRKAPIAYAYIDDDKNNKVILDGNFDEDWGDCLFLESLLIDGERAKHQVVIEIVYVPEDCQVDFYLVSLIVAKR